jgi:ankyrin repeat protein
MHAAVYMGNVECTQLLLDAGADKDLAAEVRKTT